jgi:hypothetical protein
MKKLVSKHAYFLLCGLFLFFHICDMISTDYIIHYGAGNAVEANPVAAEAQIGSGLRIILIRAATIAIVVIGLILARLDGDVVSHLKKHSAWSVIRGTMSGISSKDQYKVIAFSSLAVLSMCRVIAALSNVGGEFFKLSIPIFFDKVVGLQELRQIYFGSVIISVTLSMMILAAAWEIYRRR